MHVECILRSQLDLANLFYSVYFCQCLRWYPEYVQEGFYSLDIGESPYCFRVKRYRCVRSCCEAGSKLDQRSLRENILVRKRVNIPCSLILVEVGWKVEPN